jgi:hypothetical protein
MIAAVFAALVVVGPAAQANSTSSDLDRVVAELCAAEGSAHPVCKNDPIATDAYKWLLLADACDHDSSAGYCTRFTAIRARTEPCVVAYSHRRSRWRPTHLLETKERWAFDTDVNGVPTVAVSRSDQCTAIIEDTKPLIYGVQLGSVEEKETPLVGGLKDLAELLGATLQATAPLLNVYNLKPRSTINSAVADLRKQNARATPFEELAAATFALASSLLSIGDLEAEVVTALNAAEASDTGALTPVDWARAKLDASHWHEEFDRLRTRRLAAVDSLQGQTPDDKQRSALDQAQKVLDRQAAVAQTLTALAITKARWDQFVVDGRMMTWMVASLRPLPVGWTKDQIHTIKIVVETPFASDVTLRLAKADTSIRFASPRASMFGVGAGVIFTPLEQLTYKAVAGTDGIKRITATERDARTGQLALFIDWRVVQAFYPRASTWIVRPALEGGVAVDTKTPGFFVGASFELTKWIRLSAGRTWQSVQVLDGQRENDPIESNDSIKLRDRFEGQRYFSVSFAIDELPLFKPK